MTRTAFIYARISQDRTGAGLGVQRQEADARALAKKLGWTIARVFVDDDISAYSGKPRPAYRAMLDALAAGEADAVLCWHTDRLHRSPRELEDYIDVCERHAITTQTVQAGELDLSTPSGQAVARTLGAWARFESAHKSQRIKRAARQSAEAGKWAGGTRPFGWQLTGSVPLVDPIEGRIVHDVTHRLLAGESAGSIVRGLNTGGVATSTGKEWSYATLRQMVRRPRNAGLSEWHGEIIGQSQFPPLVTEDAWRAVCALLDDPARRHSQSNRARWLLAGIAHCECGATVRSGSGSTRNGTTHTVYRCRTSGPGHVARRAVDIDAYVSDVIVGILSKSDTLEHFAAAPGVDLTALRQEAVTLRRRLTDGSDSYADGRITIAQLERMTQRVTAQLESVETQLASSMSGSVLADFASGDVTALWKSTPIDRRRAVVDALATVTIKRVDRGAARVFDPSTIRIEPRRPAG